MNDILKLIKTGKGRGNKEINIDNQYCEDYLRNTVDCHYSAKLLGKCFLVVAITTKITLPLIAEPNKNPRIISFFQND